MRTWKKTLQLDELEGMGSLFSIRLLGFLPRPPIPKLLTARIWLPLFTQRCDTAVLRCLFNPFQLLIPLKSQEDLDKALEQLELSPSLKSLRILVSAPKKVNVSSSPSLLFLSEVRRLVIALGRGKSLLMEGELGLGGSEIFVETKLSSLPLLLQPLKG